MPRFDVMATILLEVVATTTVEAANPDDAEDMVNADIDAGLLKIVYDRAAGASPKYVLSEHTQEANIDHVMPTMTVEDIQRAREDLARLTRRTT